MAITLVQGIGKAQTTASVSTQTVTFDTALTSGNYVVMLHQGGSKTVTFTPSNGGTALTWTTLGPFDHSAQNLRLYVFYAQVTASGITTVTITRSSGTATISLGAYELSGVNTSSPYIGSDTAETVATGADGHNVATGLTPSAGAAFFGLIASTSSATWAAGTNYNQADLLSNNSLIQYRIVTSGGTYTCPASSAASETCKLVMVGFNAATVESAPELSGSSIRPNAFAPSGGWNSFGGRFGGF